MKALCLVLAACTSSAVPTATGATCPDPANPRYTWGNFGSNFFCHYCTNCHRSDLTRSRRNGATVDHNFDYLFGVIEAASHVDQQTAFGPKAHNAFMPGDGTGGRCPSVAGGMLDEPCPEPTDEERTALGEFVACELARPGDWNGPDREATDLCASYAGP